MATNEVTSYCTWLQNSSITFSHIQFNSDTLQSIWANNWFCSPLLQYNMLVIATNIHTFKTVKQLNWQWPQCKHLWKKTLFPRNLTVKPKVSGFVNFILYVMYHNYITTKIIMWFKAQLNLAYNFWTESLQIFQSCVQSLNFSRFYSLVRWFTAKSFPQLF